MAVPVRITVSDQPLPVFVVLRARLTPAELEFDPPEIDFGAVAVSESKGVTVRITNRACVPQRYALSCQSCCHVLFRISWWNNS